MPINLKMKETIRIKISFRETFVEHYLGQWGKKLLTNIFHSLFNIWHRYLVSFAKLNRILAAVAWFPWRSRNIHKISLTSGPENCWELCDRCKKYSSVGLPKETSSPCSFLFIIQSYTALWNSSSSLDKQRSKNSWNWTIAVTIKKWAFKTLELVTFLQGSLLYLHLFLDHIRWKWWKRGTQVQGCVILSILLLRKKILQADGYFFITVQSEI